VWLAVSLSFGVLLIYSIPAGDREPPATRLFGLFMVSGGILMPVGDLLYERRRTLAQSVRIAGLLSFQAGFLTFIVGLWLARDYGWFWYAAIVYALLMLAAVWHVVGKYRSEGAEERRP